VSGSSGWWRRQGGLIASLAATAFVLAAIAIPASAGATTGLFGWGVNLDGQLGDGYAPGIEAGEGPEACRWGGPGSVETVGCSDVPSAISGVAGVYAVSAGEEHVLALGTEGKTYAWGNNESDELGDGISWEEQLLNPLPVAVKSTQFNGLDAISAGAEHSVGLWGFGAVFTWGSNEVDQLGDGKTEAEEAENPVPQNTYREGWADEIAAGGYHTLALTSEGTVIAWGDGEYGQLGNNATKNRFKAVTVRPVGGGTLTGVKAVAAGEDFSLALLNNGKVDAWGYNGSGQLGEGREETRRHVAYPVSNLSGVTAIAAGAEHSLALLSNGTVMAWGDNEQGQLGDGTLTNRLTPVAVQGLSNVVAIAAGGNHSMALLSNGTVYTWGENEYGQLGTGSALEPECGNQEVCSDVPVEVPGLTGVTAISAGYQDSFAIGEYTRLGSEPLARRAARRAAVAHSTHLGCLRRHDGRPIPAKLRRKRHLALVTRRCT
jgi:alpha-tubulin suppressor-like RCC1 family protein